VKQIDFAAAEHLAAVSKISHLARWPRRCVVTKRAMEDIVKLGLTKEAVLEEVRDHLEAQKPTYVLLQASGLEAYVLLPCSVDVHDLYVKVQVPPCKRERDEYEPPKGKIDAKRKE
jgi:hypothetical protein